MEWVQLQSSKKPKSWLLVLLWSTQQQLIHRCKRGRELSRVKGPGEQPQGWVRGESCCASSPEKPTPQWPLLHPSPNTWTSSSQIQHSATWGTCWPTHRCGRLRNLTGGKGGQLLLQWDTKDLTSLSRHVQAIVHCLLRVSLYLPTPLGWWLFWHIAIGQVVKPTGRCCWKILVISVEAAGPSVQMTGYLCL